MRGKRSTALGLVFVTASVVCLSSFSLGCGRAGFVRKAVRSVPRASRSARRPKAVERARERVGHHLRRRDAHGVPEGGVVHEPRVVALLPGSAESYQRVFDDEPSVAQLAELKGLRNKFGRLERTTVPDDGLDAAALLSLNKRSDGSNTTILVGHGRLDEAGEQVLCLPSGGLIRLSSLREDGDTQCLVLTCGGRDFGVTGEVSAKHAYRMVRAGMRCYRASSRDGRLMTRKELVESVRGVRGTAMEPADWAVGTVVIVVIGAAVVSA